MIPAWAAFGRGVLQGIITYARRCDRWQFVSDTAKPPWGTGFPTDQHIDGAIVRLSSLRPEHLQTIQSMNVPVVNVNAISTSVPTVAADYERAGCLAADHLLDCGFKHFAFCGSSFVPERSFNGFYLRLLESGYEPQHWLINARPRSEQEQRMEQWIAQLPKPIGVLAINDMIGRDLIQACQRCDLRVPDDVAVIGVSNDELVCEMCAPPLSSVAISLERQGFMAAELLDKLMAGESPPTRPILIDPLHVVTRQSSDILLVDDAEVAEALRFIRRHATDRIDVSDVLRAVPVSRRTLEAKFKYLLGRGPAREIRRVKIEKAKELLATSHLSVPQIAKTVGFSSARYMSQAFHKHVGVAPRTYRMRGRIH